MTGRERLIRALDHKPTDRPPIDLGATSCSGMHASVVAALRRAMGLADRKVYVYEVLQQLGWIDEDLLHAVGADVMGLMPYRNFAGNENNSTCRKPYPIPHGPQGECLESFRFKIEPDGSRLAFPQGDGSAEASLRMPSGGYFFDCVDRSPDCLDDESDPYEDFLGVFEPISEEEADFYRRQTDRIVERTDYGIVANCAFAGFGDAAFIPGADLKRPRGIRKLDEWYMAHKVRPDYVGAVYDMQLEAALESLERLRQAVGNRIQAIFISGTDFGMQTGEMISKEDFEFFYQPRYRIINDWIHRNTTWKTMYHTCGSVVNLLDGLCECGVDVLNPVQCSACGMDARFLKETYGEKLVFWGGGIDTQRVLPFGTPEECADMARERVKIFGESGGFVFNPVHNVQGGTPVENLISMYDAVRNNH